jgi:hypothetical protein
MENFRNGRDARSGLLGDVHCSLHERDRVRVMLLRNLSSFVQGGEPLPINLDLGCGMGSAASPSGPALEMRIACGPGYRVYYVHRGAEIVILLCGGDKRTQRQDIKRAQALAERQ